MSHSVFRSCRSVPSLGGFCLRFQRILELLDDILRRGPRHDLLIPSRGHFRVNMNGCQVLLIAAPRDVSVDLQAAPSSAESDELSLQYAALLVFRYRTHDDQRFWRIFRVHHFVLSDDLPKEFRLGEFRA